MKKRLSEVCRRNKTKGSGHRIADTSFGSRLFSNKNTKNKNKKPLLLFFKSVDLRSGIWMPQQLRPLTKAGNYKNEQIN